jgi:hypothetical protein
MPITIDGTNGITQAGEFDSDSSFGFKNRLINGAMVIDQRNNGASISVSTDVGTYSVDRWKVGANGGGVFSAQRSTTAPTGFTNSLLVTVTTADSSLAATDYYNIQQRIEGFNVADFGLGTANAATFTISFWVRSSLTGTFGGSLYNNAANRSYPFTYVINAANTFEYKTITVVGDTTGTWTTDNSAGLTLSLSLGSGSTYLASAGSWTGALEFGATGQVNTIATSGATFYITGVQLEKGSTATSFDYRPYGTELALCQRYLPYFSSNGSTAASLGIGQTIATTAALGIIAFPVQTRVPPTGITISSVSHFSGTQTNGGQSAYTGLIFNASNVLCSEVYGTGASGLGAAGGASNLRMNNLSAYIYFTGCEL